MGYWDRSLDNLKQVYGSSENILKKKTFY